MRALWTFSPGKVDLKSYIQSTQALAATLDLGVWLVFSNYLRKHIQSTFFKNFLKFLPANDFSDRGILSNMVWKSLHRLILNVNEQLNRAEPKWI